MIANQAKCCVFLVVLLLGAWLVQPAAAQLYYMPYGAPIPYGPTTYYGSGFGYRPLSSYERNAYYQQRYFNRTYIRNGNRYRPVGLW